MAGFHWNGRIAGFHCNGVLICEEHSFRARSLGIRKMYKVRVHQITRKERHRCSKIRRHKDHEELYESEKRNKKSRHKIMKFNNVIRLRVLLRTLC